MFRLSLLCCNLAGLALGLAILEAIYFVYILLVLDYSLAESLYNLCSTLVAFRSFILCFLDGYNIALCNDELYLVKGGPASGSIILIVYFLRF